MSNIELGGSDYSFSIPEERQDLIENSRDYVQALNRQTQLVQSVNRLKQQEDVAIGEERDRIANILEHVGIEMIENALMILTTSNEELRNYQTFPPITNHPSGIIDEE